MIFLGFLSPPARQTSLILLGVVILLSRALRRRAPRPPPLPRPPPDTEFLITEWGFTESAGEWRFTAPHN